MDYNNIKHGPMLLAILHRIGPETTFRDWHATVKQCCGGDGPGARAMLGSVQRLVRHGWVRSPGTITKRGRNVKLYYGPIGLRLPVPATTPTAPSQPAAS